MKRTLVITLCVLIALPLFYLLVHAVLVAAHVSQPAPTTVNGMTPRRVWAITADLLSLVGVIIGGLSLARLGSRFGASSGQFGAIVALVTGLLGAINGALVLAFATGGPGSGNGVIGGAGALVLGVIGMVLGGLALARFRSSRNIA